MSNYRGDSEWNPDCDLEKVGSTVEKIESGIAVKADFSHLRPSIVRDVHTLHMIELKAAGVLDAFWRRYRHNANGLDGAHCDGLTSDLKVETTGDEQRRASHQEDEVPSGS